MRPPRVLLERLVKDFGYCDACRSEMLAYFLRYRDEVQEAVICDAVPGGGVGQPS